MISLAKSDAGKPENMKTIALNLRRMAALLAACLLVEVFPARAGQNLSDEKAHSPPVWLRDGVIYEIFTRNFSAEGTFSAVTARLDELKDLGVNVL